MNKLAVACILLALNAPSVAASDIYFGLKTGNNRIDYPNTGESRAYGILGGIIVGHHIVAEIDYSYLGEENTQHISGKVLSIAALAYFPINNDIALQFKLGGATSMITVNAANYHNTSPLYGLGAQYNLTNSVGLRVNHDIFFVGNGSTNAPTKTDALTSLGIVFAL